MDWLELSNLTQLYPEFGKEDLLEIILITYLSIVCPHVTGIALPKISKISQALIKQIALQSPSKLEYIPIYSKTRQLDTDLFTLCAKNGKRMTINHVRN